MDSSMAVFDKPRKQPQTISIYYKAIFPLYSPITNCDKA